MNLVTTHSKILTRIVNICPLNLPDIALEVLLERLLEAACEFETRNRGFVGVGASFYFGSINFGSCKIRSYKAP